MRLYLVLWPSIVLIARRHAVGCTVDMHGLMVLSFQGCGAILSYMDPNLNLNFDELGSGFKKILITLTNLFGLL